MGLLIEMLGLVLAVAVALGALKRNGVDIGWLNPFTFFHRMRWKKKSCTPPLYALDHPIGEYRFLAIKREAFPR